MAKAPGTKIAGYRVVELLGAGGMGEVYVVENEQLQRREAVKLISVGASAENQDFQQRFNNEARTMAALDHPSIITIHNYGIEDGQPWFSMSYLDGPNLATARLTPSEVVTAIGQVADALDYAHASSVVHRDIKPANIVVTRHSDGRLRRAVLLDFGIAKLADSPQLTAVNSIISTVTYTAPEVIQGIAAGPASDQYSLACTVFELLAGQTPFKAETPTSLMMAHIQEQPPALGTIRPDLNMLGPVLTKAMAKDPAARYPDCRAFAAALDVALNQPAAHQTATQQPAIPPSVYPSGPQPTPPHTPGTGALTQFGATVAAPYPATLTPGTTPQPAPQMQLPNSPFAGQQFSGQQYSGQQFAGQQFSGQQFAPGPPSFPGQPFGFTGGQLTARKKSKTPWIIAAVVAVLAIAVAGTSPLWWPSSSDTATVEAFSTPQTAGSSGSQCMIDEGELFCWGDNSNGQLGIGSTASTKTPTKVPGLTNVTAVAMGAFTSSSSNSVSATTCAVANEALYCWGENLFNQAGDPSSTSDKTSPFKVPGLGKVTTVATSYSSTCAVSDGDLYCWGFYAGALGQPNDSESLSAPTKVPGLSNVTAVSSRSGSVCAIASAELYCWGRNWNGQLGDGTTNEHATPTKVSSLKNVTSVSVGGGNIDKLQFWNTCAVADREVYCWGNNQNKQVNSSSDKSISTPLRIQGLTGASQVTVDIGSFCAVVDGKASCWGNNTYGQLGLGSTSRQYTPTEITTLSDVQQIETNSSVTCALTLDARYCWGINKLGQAGDPAVTSDKLSVPQQIKLADA
ncbi:protein kinase domain-containing protein [Gordonia sp. (in: high G+C Gram-positive bacteria)]|uniref:protein kinase domain-containing protein n=1 Tax=Gordonia sp. (in: high G+C Gram-positive bacteria) TaxID=84139 RepID=UPI003C76F08D